MNIMKDESKKSEVLITCNNASILKTIGEIFKIDTDRTVKFNVIPRHISRDNPALDIMVWKTSQGTGIQFLLHIDLIDTLDMMKELRGIFHNEECQLIIKDEFGTVALEEYCGEWAVIEFMPGIPFIDGVDIDRSMYSRYVEATVPPEWIEEQVREELTVPPFTNVYRVSPSTWLVPDVKPWYLRGKVEEYLKSLDVKGIEARL